MQLESAIGHIEQELRTHLMSVSLVDGQTQLQPHDDVLRSGLIDSMGVMELVSLMEEKFAISVDDVEIIPDNFCSLRAMTRYVAGKKEIPFEDSGDPIVEDFRRLVAESVPPGAIVLVASHGDEGLVQLGDQTGWHFPRDASGCYAGYNPSDSQEAIKHIEALRSLGATHVGFPSSELWWLDHYSELRGHLESRCREVARNGAGAIYSLV